MSAMQFFHFLNHRHFKFRAATNHNNYCSRLICKIFYRLVATIFYFVLVASVCLAVYITTTRLIDASIFTLMNLCRNRITSMNHCSRSDDVRPSVFLYELCSRRHQKLILHISSLSTSCLLVCVCVCACVSVAAAPRPPADFSSLSRR